MSGIGAISGDSVPNLRNVLGLNSDFRAALLATPGIRNLYMLTEASGTVIRDQLAANHGVYTTPPTLGGAGPFIGYPYTAPTFASASSQYGQVNPFVEYGGDFTLLAWVKLAAAALEIAVDMTGGGGGVWLGMQAGGSGPAGFSISGSTTAVAAGLADSTWHLLAGSLSGTVITCSIDGVAGTPQTLAGGTRAAQTSPVLHIGCHSSVAYFLDGQEAAVAYLSRGLPTAELRALWKVARLG